MQGGVETNRAYVDEFIQFAKEHPHMTFLVTRIGCGIAGFDDSEIAPLFEGAHEVENIVLPEGWWILDVFVEYGREFSGEKIIMLI